MNGPEQGPAPRTERRRSVRYACLLGATFGGGGTVGYHPVQPARVLDVSRHGVALHASERFSAGDDLTLTLHREGAGEAFGPLRVRVVWSNRMPNGTWRLGADFERPLTEDEVRALIA